MTEQRRKDLEETLKEINNWSDRQSEIGGNFGRYMNINTHQVFMFMGLIERELNKGNTISSSSEKVSPANHNI